MNGSYIKIIFELLQINGKTSIVRTIENKEGGHPEIWKRGKEKSKIKTNNVSSVNEARTHNPSKAR